MSDTEKIHVPPGDPQATQRLWVFDAKARSCPGCHSIGDPKDGCEHPWHDMGIQPDATLVHQFQLGGDLDWAGGLCELHCREDRCGDKGQRCKCPGHQEDGTHIVQTTVHEGIHGWLAHDSYPLHQHNPVTKSIRWATTEEIQRVRDATRPYSDPRHCADEVLCVNQCASGPCSRECTVCRRLAWSGESESPPCPACPDSPKSQAGQAARRGRCPDGGYCHGSSLAAGSPPCRYDACWRVQTSSPLSGVYPGDQWPAEVIAGHHPKNDGHVCGRQGCVLPAGHNQGNADIPSNHQPEGADLRKAVAMSAEAARCFRVAITTDDQHAIEAHLALAASLAQDAVRIAVRAHQNLTGKETIKFQGQVYTQ